MILNMSHKKELLRGLWVDTATEASFRASFGTEGPLGPAWRSTNQLWINAGTFLDGPLGEPLWS